jgi:chaperonin GroEL
MAKQIMYGESAVLKLREGLRKAFETVKTTFGPSGKNVLVEKKFGSPEVTKDALTVSKELEVKDPFINMGIKFLNEVCDRTNDKVGDGTALAAILLHSLYEGGLNLINFGVKPQTIREVYSKLLNITIEELTKRKKLITDSNQYKQIATVSSGNNEKIGELLSEAVVKIGGEGIITVEESKSAETVLDWAKGYQFDKGFVSPYFITNLEKYTCELEEPYILIYDRKIANLQEFIPVLEQVVPTGKPLFIICDEIEGEPLATLVINKLSGAFLSCAVKTPGYGDRRKAMLEDIAIFTGGMYISEDSGLKLENVTLQQLGRAKKVIVEKERSIIIDGQGKQESIESRKEQIRRAIKETTSDYDRDKLKERLAKITGGVATIKVGAHTESLTKELKSLVENAVHAVVAARDEGILPGGGISLLKVSKIIENTPLNTNEEEAIKKVFVNALKAPSKQILANALGEEGTKYLEEIAEKPFEIGLDITTKEFTDFVSKGIIDPYKVVKIALENATSIAKVLLCSSTLVAELKKKKEKVEGAVA